MPLLSAALLLGVLGAIPGNPAAGAGALSAGMLGADISWPNCPRGMGVAGRRTLGLPMPAQQAQFFIVGLTNGRAFTRNPCLAWQLAQAEARGVRIAAYTMLSYPNRLERLRHRGAGPYPTTTLAGQISNVGYAQALFALDTMAAAGLAAPMVWIDVEPRAERRWSTNKANNRALVTGALRAAADRGVGSGLYTYANAWRQIVGSWRLDLPLWAPSHTHAATYAARQSQSVASCARVSFTGGPLVMTQWVWRNRDHNVTCPAIAATATPLFLEPTAAIPGSSATGSGTASATAIATSTATGLPAGAPSPSTTASLVPDASPLASRDPTPHASATTDTTPAP